MKRKKLIDPLGAYHTPTPLARAIADRVVECTDLRFPYGKTWEHVMDPHVGEGHLIRPLIERFPDPFDSPTFEVSDLDPFAAGLHTFGDRVQLTPYAAGQRINIRPGGDRSVRCPVCEEVVTGRGPRGRASVHGKRGAPCPGTHAEGIPIADEWIEDPIRCGFMVRTPKRRPTIVIMNPPYGVGVPWRTSSPEPVAHLHVERALEVSTIHVFAVLRHSWIGPKRHRYLTDSPHLRAVWVIRPRPRYVWLGGAEGTDSGPSALFWWDKSHTAPRRADGSTRFEGGYIDWNPEGDEAEDE